MKDQLNNLPFLKKKKVESSDDDAEKLADDLARENANEDEQDQTRALSRSALNTPAWKLKLAALSPALGKMLKVNQRLEAPVSDDDKTDTNLKVKPTDAAAKRKQMIIRGIVGLGVLMVIVDVMFPSEETPAPAAEVTEAPATKPKKKKRAKDAAETTAPVAEPTVAVETAVPTEATPPATTTDIPIPTEPTEATPVTDITIPTDVTIPTDIPTDLTIPTEPTTPTDVPATDVPATDVSATDVPATDVSATDVSATDIPATSDTTTPVDTPITTDGTIPLVEAPVDGTIPTDATIPTDTPTDTPVTTPDAVATEEPSTVPSGETANTDQIVDTPAVDGGDMTDKILEDLEKQLKQNEKKSTVQAVEKYVPPPQYDYPGRGLVYNCRGKHWACIDAGSYQQCAQNHGFLYTQKKGKECYPDSVYNSDSACRWVQKNKITSNAKTNFCN